MKIINLNIEEIKSQYKKTTKIKIDNICFNIGFRNGAIKEFILFRKGKQFPVITDGKKITFIVFND